MKPRVLITGASGFVGYHLIQEALKQDLEVFAAVRRSSNLDHLKDLDIHFLYFDYSHLDNLIKNIEVNNLQYIIHAAGATSAKFEEFYNIFNAYYTYNLARAAANRVKKFVFISSLAAIGPSGNLTIPLTDSSAAKPITAYGRSKLLAEERLASIPALDYIILRPTAVYGPRERGIFIVLRQIGRHLEPYISRQKQAFSFIYVKDLAAISVKALFSDKKGSYNLCDGNTYGKYDLGNIAKEILNLRTIKFHLPVTFVKLIAYISEKIGYLTGNSPALNLDKLKELTAVSWACDIEAAKTDLGFNPTYDLEKGLKETIAWYKEHQWL